MELACGFCSAPAAARCLAGALLLAFWARGRRFLRTSPAKGGVFQKAPRSERWERGRCLLLPGAPSPERLASPRAAPRAPRALARPPGSPRRRPGRGRGLRVAGFSRLGAQKTVLKTPSLRRRSWRQHPQPPGPVPPLAVASDRDWEERAGGGDRRESAPGIRRVWGKPETRASWISFVCLLVWGGRGAQRCRPRFPLWIHSAEMDFLGERL